jgi:hypothetical protein
MVCSSSVSHSGEHNFQLLQITDRCQGLLVGRRPILPAHREGEFTGILTEDLRQV